MPGEPDNIYLFFRYYYYDVYVYADSQVNYIYACVCNASEIRWKNISVQNADILIPLLPEIFLYTLCGKENSRFFFIFFYV